MSEPAAEVGRLLQSGNFAAAKVLLQNICVASPNNADAWHNLAVAQARLGEVGNACHAIERALKLQPENSRSLLLAATVHQDAGDLTSALAFAGKVSSADPAFAQARNLAGILLADMGRSDEAEGAFRDAIRVNPQYARAFGNLAGVCLRSGRPQDALSAAQSAVRLQPDYAHAHYMVASARLVMGAATEAIASLREALNRQPAFIDAWLMLARIYRQQLAIDAALEAVRRALAISPARVDAQCVLGDLLATSGDTTGSRQVYGSVQRAHPEHLEAALRQALLLPVEYRDSGHIDEARNGFVRGLESLIARRADFAKLSRQDLLNQVQYSNFYLAYQGRDDLPLQRKYAGFVASLLKSVLPEYFVPKSPQPVRGRRLRVGFVSRFFYASTAGNYFASWITDLDYSSFELFAFYTHTQEDELTARIRARADVFAPFQPDIASLARQIADSTLDVLVYPELGMDARTFTLAALRLAPVQVAGWGHPVTTGHENIDYFLSCAMMEPEGAQSHYCESLALLPGLGTRYELPAMPAALREKDRRQYQLPEGRTLYLAPQSLFKIHPDNDALFVEILARDPDGVLVFFGGAAATARDIFVNRLRRAFAARALSTAGRVKILPDVSHADYQRINELCDVMLDSMHWSGGNTSLDALSAGLPIVTLPGTFMRGRQSMAMLRMLDCDELIAASETEYVEIALRLGRDPAKRKALSAHILQSHHKLFDDASASTAFARFLQRVTQSASE